MKYSQYAVRGKQYAKIINVLLQNERLWELIKVYLLSNKGFIFLPLPVTAAVNKKERSR